tara:strand:+ start:239 stop:913 length:675 start_codon:yes stop_codon:yes gene_type:complete
MSNILARTRLGIWKTLENTDPPTSICFEDKFSGRSFLYPIDAFKKYLKHNTNVLNTNSYKENGVYHWPRVPSKYFEFLENYEVRECDKGYKTSSERNYNPPDTENFLNHFHTNNGHCFISNMLLDDEKDKKNENNDTDKMYAYAAQIRLRYKNNELSESEISSLKNLGFIFHTKLGHYFKIDNKDDREYLIKVLNRLTIFEKEAIHDRATTSIEHIRDEADNED